MNLIFRIYQDSDAQAITDIWNSAMIEQHGFFPVTPHLLMHHYSTSKRFKPEYLLIASDGLNALGFIHFDIVDVPPYARAGVICAIAVHPDYQLQGIGSSLLAEAINTLEKKHIKFIDAAGAWPYSSFYATIIDGSERAGVNLNNKGGAWLFSKYNFSSERESNTMHCDLKNTSPDHSFEHSNNLIYNQERLGKDTWLDHSFRGWKLYDHALLSPSGKVLSRAIYGRMDGVSDYTQREVYALFSVSTPNAQLRKGHATRNLQMICQKLHAAGVEKLELHVYSDNMPAVRLYNKIGFFEAGKTVIMRRHHKSTR